MNAPICAFSFNVAEWNVVCNKPLFEQDWQQRENHWWNEVSQREPISPKLAFLPPLKRRRLSDSARLFFEVAYPFAEQYPNLPVVYASLNSEINRSFVLWDSLLREGDVSPTSFSLSVHNALVGQWSELCQVTNEVTALTARRDSLEVALMEASMLLNEGQERVLVVVVESPLYEKYNAQPVERQPFAYALAMVVEKGEQYRLSLNSTEKQPHFLADNALIWLQQQHLAQQQWQTPSSRGYWQWVKS